MPTFVTSEPITASIELAVGDTVITASDRTDTVVEVRPSDPDSEVDVRAAAETRVEFTPGSGLLVVRGPKQRGLGRMARTASIDIAVDLPTGSQVDASAAVATFRLHGRMGACRLKTSSGGIQIQESGPLDVATSAGTVTVDRVSGDADVRTASGRLRIGEIDGSAVIKNSNGDCWVGDVHGDLRINAANGDIAVDRARGNVDAATANGDVRVGDVARGSASLKTAMGQIEVGVHAGSAARFDAHTSMGRVRNELDATDRPSATDQRVEVRARTSYGDIRIHRAPAGDGR
jgi:hypothetical protein